MAATLTLNQTNQPPRIFGNMARGLLSRIADVSKNLTAKAIELSNTDNKLEKAVSVLTNSAKAAWNSSREDKLWMGLTVAAGIGAKLAAFSALNIASGGTVTAALIGGAAVGLTKSLINSYRESKKEDNLSFTNSFFSKKTLMTTASTTALSAASFGLLSGVESLTGINIAEKIGQGLHYTFNAVAKFGKTAGQLAFIHLPLGAGAHGATLKVPMAAPLTTTAPASAIVTQPTSGRPAVTGSHTHQPQRVVSVKPIVEPISTAYKNEYAIERLSALLIKVGEIPKENATALDLAKQFAPNTQNPDSLVRALESQAPKPVLQASAGQAAQPAQAKAAAPLKPAVDQPVVTQPAQAVQPKPDFKQVDGGPSIEVKLPDGTVMAVQMPPRPDIKTEWKLAFDKVHAQELDILVRAGYQSQFGNEAPSHLKASDIAKLINSENTNQYLADLTEKAEGLAKVALPPEKMRGACLSDLPATEQSHQARGRILPNICSIDNDAPLQAGEYITMRDVGEPIAKPEKRGLWQGVRAIFAGATTPAHKFMETAIGKIEINNMAGDKLAIDLR